MPNIKSAKKSVRTNQETAINNTVYTSKVRNSIKKVKKAVQQKDNETANSELKIAIANIDKCVSKGIMKQNTGDRKKSRINKLVKEM